MSEELSKLQELEKRISEDDALYYKGKMIFCPEMSRKISLTVFKSTLDQHLRRVLHEYDMDLVTFGDRQILRCQLSPVQLLYIQAVSDFLCKDSNLKELPTYFGKSAEMIFRNSINNIFNLFGLKKRLHVNSKNYFYGGDGGADFFLGNYSIDVKVRNDSPAHGMILTRDFLDRTLDSTILVHATNATSIKIGTIPPNKTLPLALSGWITVGDFKARAKPISGGSLAVDNFNPIVNLLLLLLEDQVLAEELFTYSN